MLPVPNLIILSAFTFMGISLAIGIISFRRKGRTFLGIPPINKYLFYSGKTCLFFAWGLCIFRCIFPADGMFAVPVYIRWAAAILMAAAAIIITKSFIDLGSSLKVGLPDQETKLRTGGIYRFSRNPIYLSVFMVNIASCLFFPHPVNILCSIYGIYIHYLITLSEEKFLAQRFGQEWDDYRRNVRRYL
jgi:protein-S-isoprenylcysteine O-methyltransferase Ste14